MLADNSDRSFLLAARALAVTVGALATYALSGWIFHDPTAIRILPDFATMKVNTALGLFLSALSLLLSTAEVPRLRQIGKWLAVAVATVGILTLLEYALAADFGIDESLLKDTVSGPGNIPGRMSALTAASFVLLALGVATTRRRPIGTKVYVASCTIGLALMLLVLIGYAYGVKALSHYVPSTSIALHTALSFFGLFASLAMLQPNSSGFRVVTARTPLGLRMIPLVLLAIPIFGWIHTRSGIADLADGRDGLAIFTLLFIAILLTSTSRHVESLEETKAAAAERDRESAELRHETEERFRCVFENAPLAMGFVDNSGKVVALNAHVERVFGYTSADIATLDQWWLKAYPNPKHRESAVATWAEYLKRVAVEPTAAPGEYHITAKDGSDRIALVSGIALPNGVIAAMTDITARRHAEQAAYLADITARQQIEHTVGELEAALSAMSDAVLISDAKGNFVHHNEACLSFHRLTQTCECPSDYRAYGSLVEICIPTGEPLPSHAWPVARALRGEAANDEEYLLRRKDTGESWMGSCNFAPIHDRSGEVVGSVVTARDITGRHRAEEELFQNREQLRLLFDYAPVALALFDRNMRYLVASRRWLSDYGLGEQDVRGRSHYEVFPDIPAQWKEVHCRCLSGEVITCEEELFARQGFPPQWVRWEVRPWRERDGSIGGIIIFAEDITARKTAAEELQQSLIQLAQSEKLNALGQLTGGIAHDFNNLLAVIQGSLEMLGAGTSTSNESRRYVDNALRAVKSGASLVRGLLAFSRRQNLRPERINLNAFVAGLAEVFSRTLGGNTSLETRLAPDVKGVTIDPAQLESALLNLVVNARDAMPEGGTVTISTGTADLDAEAAYFVGLVPGHYETVTVSDTGVGMSAETAARVFEPFFSTKDAGKGSGLGLSMVYGFATQSQGTVKIYSEPGFGTSVKIFLPDAHANESGPRAAQQKASAEYRGIGETILLVEDREDVREMVSDQLVALGYKVIAAKSGSDALALVQSSEQIDLMLTDILMPAGISGVDLATAARDVRRRLPVVYMSGNIGGSHINTQIRSEKIQLLEKPFTRAQLSEAIARALGQLESEGQWRLLRGPALSRDRVKSYVTSIESPTSK